MEICHGYLYELLRLSRWIEFVLIFIWLVGLISTISFEAVNASIAPEFANGTSTRHIHLNDGSRRLTTVPQRGRTAVTGLRQEFPNVDCANGVIQVL